MRRKIRPAKCEDLHETLLHCRKRDSPLRIVTLMKPEQIQKDRPLASEQASSRRLYLFLGNNKIVLNQTPDGCLATPFYGLGDKEWNQALTKYAFSNAKPVLIHETEGNAIFFAATSETDLGSLAGQSCAFPLIELYEEASLSPELASDLPIIRQNAIRIPYLYFEETDYIYRFRTERQRNRHVYQTDETSVALYHSKLCDAIKALKRTKERSATSPAILDFGATQYLLPSHFGFCLGVQNAIERAYETIAENPGKRVFMLSELIHNPFVNEDLKARGLNYLQSDKGVPLRDPNSGSLYWDTLKDDDIVIIPAFGARDEDKVKLIERGLPINQYDATCMLVEKVWKAAKRYGQQGYTVVIHGKAEHEETKATFSNSAIYAPSLVIRDLREAEILRNVILEENGKEQRRLFESLATKASPDFDPGKHLERLAFVNQTTLLRNETLKIIDFVQAALVEKYGESHVEEHMAMSSKGDTLCYATQVNQDALSKALQEEIDVALVVGGKNSSNTFQLFRLCQEAFGERAFYIQSEANILSKNRISHFIFPYDPKDPKQGRMEERAFLSKKNGIRILITGGASCPDGILQQIIAKINGFFDSRGIRSMDAVLAELS